MADHAIERAFLTLPGRQVHYRRAGSGPPVVLLHQSPKSAEELIPLIRLLASYFTVLAPDTPGYGLSDPIAHPDSEPEIDLFADAVAAFFDGMGLKRAGVYGLHTGAAIGTRFAARYPERVAALVANGTLIKTPEERADMLAHYLPRFVPSWDGAHLAWAWARLREQLFFFPWHRRDPAARIAVPLTNEGLQSNLLPLLEAGDNYRTAYRTAFSYQVEEDLPRLSVPARFVCAEPDALFRYLDRFPPLPANAAIARVPDAVAAMSFARDFFREIDIAEPGPAAIPTAPISRRLASWMVGDKGRQIHVRGNKDGAGRPIVVLHETGASSGSLSDLLGGFIGRRPIYAPDLPGHGASDPASTEADLISASADRLAAEIPDPVDIVALGDSAAIALEWARLPSAKVAGIALCDPMLVPDSRLEEFDRHYVPDLTPDWAGGHLLRAWHCARDRDLFWPWFDKAASAILPGGVPASDAVVQRRALDLLKSAAIHARFASALFHAPLLETLRSHSGSIHLFASVDRSVDPKLAAIVQPIRLPRSMSNWAIAILDVLEQ